MFHFILFRADDDLRHGLDDLDRMPARGRFRGQHDGIGAVHHGIGDIGDLRPRRNGRRDHGFHHLRGHDHDFVLMARFLNDQLLQAGELRKAHLHAQIAARHHHAIAGFDHGGQILDRLGALDFGDQQAVAPGLAQQQRASSMSAASRGKDTPR